jgi:spore germination protein YaaH
MAYDQYSTSSTKAGTTAGYNWVETSLKKFIETEEIDSEKIILGVPFYTRLWTEKGTDLSSKTVNMKSVDEVLPKTAQKVWDDTLKQYYVEYTEGQATKKMWIEDLESIKAKVSLVSEYQLGGVASWEKDRELDGVWSVIKEALQ